MRWTVLASTTAAVVTTALVGGAATDPSSRWYRRLDAPAWQPPPAVFGPVWTALYGSIAWSGARVLDRQSREDRSADRSRYLVAYGANLALNAGWSLSFFGAQRPVLAAVDNAVLAGSTYDLVRRTWQEDAVAGAVLLPYAAWVTFAAALSAEIARRNAP